MNAKPLFGMTSAEVQQGFCAGWLDLHCWPATGCPMPHHPLAELLQQHLLVSQGHWQCSPAPGLPSLSLRVGCTHTSAPTSPSTGSHGTQGLECNSSLQQGYSSNRRREAYPLDISYTGLCFAICISRGFTVVMAALTWYVELLLNDDNTMLLICHFM